MRKGELQKEKILQTANTLFLSKGYENTSVQDILDALQLSKGGFYHYFESKQSLLAQICQSKTQQQFESIKHKLSINKLSPTQRLGLLLTQPCLMLSLDETLFSMMLNVCYIDGDVNFREAMRQDMFSGLLPLINDAIQDGCADGSFFTRYTQYIGRLLLNLAYDINDEICQELSKDIENADSILNIHALLNTYRDSCEKLLGANYGSIDLVRYDLLPEKWRIIRQKLNNASESEE